MDGMDGQDALMEGWMKGGVERWRGGGMEGGSEGMRGMDG